MDVAVAFGLGLCRLTTFRTRRHPPHPVMPAQAGIQDFFIAAAYQNKSKKVYPQITQINADLCS
jgi:hypothetical protein